MRHLRATLLAAALLSLLVTEGCSSPSRCPPGASCPPPPLPSLTYALTINGRPVPPAKNGEAPRIRVQPGQQVLIKVAVTLPRNIKTTALSLGISAGPFGFNRKHRPANLNPVLARTHETLTGGPHTFTLRWRIPMAPCSSCPTGPAPTPARKSQDPSPGLHAEPSQNPNTERTPRPHRVRLLCSTPIHHWPT
jgi:hypothetical protein